jgi:phosphate acetyltransferase
MNFLEEICKKAKANIKTIVLPESTDIRTLQAASTISKEGIANIILIGNKEEVAKLGQDIDLFQTQIIDPSKYERFEQLAQNFYELRKSKGITLEQAKEKVKDPLYFGVMLVKEGIADGMVAGAINSTANTLRPALQILKTAPGIKLVSSFFVMDIPDCTFGLNGKFVFADCGLVENPDANQLSEIAISAATSFKKLLNAEPTIGMLSYSTYGSAKSELTQKVVDATRMVKEKSPDLQIDGELQLDAAIVPSVGKQKAPTSTVAGNANVLVFPDLNSGNIGYKLVQRLAKAEAYGPVTQGLSKPVNDLSRGCSAEDIVGVVAITAVQAQDN